METTSALTVFKAPETKFPSGEIVTPYIEELSVHALNRLEYMTIEHEKGVVTRYEIMHCKYMDGSLRNFNAQVFSSDKNVKKFMAEYHIAEQLGDGDKMMSVATARDILQFLFSYYWSYDEATILAKKHVELKSFSKWFRDLQLKVARRQRAEIKKREKEERKLTGRRKKEYARRLRMQTDQWERNWKNGGDARRLEHFNAMKHVVLMDVEETIDIDWWKLFKVSEKKILRSTDLKDIEHEVLRKHRIWSPYVHPDSQNNQRLGLACTQLLKHRHDLMTRKKNQMMKWFHVETIFIEKLKKTLQKKEARERIIKAKQENKKLKIQNQGFKDGRNRVFNESDSNN